MKRAKKQKVPPGWTEESIRKLAEYYDNQSEDEQVTEHEAALRAQNHTLMVVPTELVLEIAKLIAKKIERHEARRSGEGAAKQVNGRIKAPAAVPRSKSRAGG
jgi:hypothetical protein